MSTHSITIGAFEAKTKLGELLERVSKGASFTITKHNKPVACLTGFEDEEDEAAQLARRVQATKELRELSKRYSLNGLSIRELREEGRR
jgi:prevent-host-death family protein